MRTITVEETEDLHIGWSSMEYDDDRDEVRADARDVFRAHPVGHPSTRGLDVIGFSETEGDPVRPVLRDEAHRRNYHFDAGGPGGVAFALAPWCELLERVDVRVLAPLSGPNPHGERSVFGPVFRTPAGNVVAYLLGHWTTLDRGLGPWEAMTEAMIENVQRVAAGRSIGVWAGDRNVRDSSKPDAFSRAGLSTVWDARGEYPDTYGRPDDGGPIDVIGTYDPDARVEVIDAHVGPRKGRHSDHRKITAHVRVNPTKGRPGWQVRRDDDTNPLRP